MDYICILRPFCKYFVSTKINIIIIIYHDKICLLQSFRLVNASAPCQFQSGNDLSTYVDLTLNICFKFSIFIKLRENKHSNKQTELKMKLLT